MSKNQDNQLHRITTFILTSLIAILSTNFTNTAKCSENARVPNIVLILTDDLGYGELGCYGGRDVPTPRLDALARAGIRFTQAYVTAPYCAPSRAALLTGRYQARFGFESNPTGARNAEADVGMALTERTLADACRQAGYATALVGKWHLGGTARFHPQRRGFDEFFGFLHEGHYYVPPPWDGVTTWLRRTALPDGGKGRWQSANGRVVWSTHMGHREPDYDADNPLLRNSQPVEEPAHLTDALTREAESFIRRHRHQPFLLYLAYNAVHSPMQGADRYMDRFKNIDDVHRRIFAAMLAQLDDGIGQVLDQIHACGLAEHTLVVFLSDNGGATRELTSRNDPLRGEKGTLYEGGVRVPFIMTWPGRLPAGRTEDRPVIALDIFPTALAAAGIARNPKDAPLDGVNLLPFLTGANAHRPHNRFFWRMTTGAKATALRLGDWKIVTTPGGVQLFDLAKDVGERTDVAKKHPERVAELQREWAMLAEQFDAAQPR